jgi:guanylate kinase
MDTQLQISLEIPEDCFIDLLGGPAGAGKTTLQKMLLLHFPERFVRAVTCTTRAPRMKEDHTGMEVDGVDYYFLDPEDFLTRVNKGEFIEYANVHGANYGTLKSEINKLARTEKNILLNVDVQGAERFRHAALKDENLKKAMVQIFLCPLSKDILIKRLNKRNSDSAAQIANRLAKADDECRASREFDFFIPSGSPEADMQKFMSIIDSQAMLRWRFPESIFNESVV